MATTPYYNLNKPDGSDRVDITTLNANMDILDTVVKQVSDKANEEVYWSQIVNKPASMPASDVYEWAKASRKPDYTYLEVGADPAGAADGALVTAKAYTDDEILELSTSVNTALAGKVSSTEKGAASGVATLDANGLVPSSQLPSFVDDVIEGYYYEGKFYEEASHITEIDGETGKIYVDLSTEKTYRWSGSIFVEISESLALGETSSTAYRGDRGKTAYDHSQTTGNAHSMVKGDIGLGNVDNTSDADKPVSTATQTALNGKVDKVAGKGLSTEDYSTDEKDKLSGIETGAQANVQSNWNEADASSDAYILNKPTNVSAFTNDAQYITMADIPASDVTGVKGDAESTYRGGNVNITKGNIGLSNVENKSSATIRGELTFTDVTQALGYVPPQTGMTYSFQGGVNKFTVTPSEGQAQDVNITPSIADNVTGSGTSGKLVKFNGTNTVTDGPALGNDTTKFLRNDGTWAEPPGTQSITEGSTNGTISVDGTDVNVHGLKSAAYKEEADFHTQLTWAAYQALPSSKESNGVEYFITDLDVTTAPIDDVNPAPNKVYSSEKTQNELDGKVDWASASRSVKKNLLWYDLALLQSINAQTGKVWDDNECTVNGITFTINEDMSITANGTATGGDGDLYLFTNKKNSEIYSWNGCILNGSEGGSLNSYFITMMMTDSPYTHYAYATDGDVMISGIPNDNTESYCILRIGSGQTVNNLVFKPMVRLATVTDDTYAPYVPDNAELAKQMPKWTAGTTAITGATSCTITDLAISDSATCVLEPYATTVQDQPTITVSGHTATLTFKTLTADTTFYLKVTNL